MRYDHSAKIAEIKKMTNEWIDRKQIIPIIISLVAIAISSWYLQAQIDIMKNRPDLEIYPERNILSAEVLSRPDSISEEVTINIRNKGNAETQNISFSIVPIYNSLVYSVLQSEVVRIGTIKEKTVNQVKINLKQAHCYYPSWSFSLVETYREYLDFFAKYNSEVSHDDSGCNQTKLPKGHTTLRFYFDCLNCEERKFYRDMDFCIWHESDKECR